MKRKSEISARIKRTAELTGVSVRSVRRVIIGDQVNENVLQTYMDLEEMEEVMMRVYKNKLVKAVEELIPLN